MADPLAAGTRNTSNLVVSSPCVLSERSYYPVNLAVDLTQLRSDALRKYMTAHGISAVPGCSREQLVVTVARHFNEECKKADESSSIASFVTFLSRSSNTIQSADPHPPRPMFQLKHRKQNHDDDKENSMTSHNSEDTEAILEDAGGLDDCQAHRAKLEDVERPFVVKKRRALNPNNKSRDRRRVEADDGRKMYKKKRKGRRYCICKGGSFGNMIACDNKTCQDRSNWYHMSCVDLDPVDDPPETWHCPACQELESANVPENQYRKPVASVTYGDMISHALTVLPEGKGSFKEICDFVETVYESQLNWKLESDQRKSPVWKSSVRKILFSNVRFRKHPQGKGMFCLAA